MTNLELKEKKNIFSFISHLSETANKNKWIANYDPEADTLSVRKSHLSADAQKKYINDEFAFYMNKKREVEGIFMEYFLSNFVSHHKDFKSMVKDIAQKRDEEKPIELTNFKIVDKLEAVILNSLKVENCSIGSKS